MYVVPERGVVINLLAIRERVDHCLDVVNEASRQTEKVGRRAQLD